MASEAPPKRPQFMLPGKVALKKVSEKVPFVECSVDMTSKSPTTIMRELDAFRFYTPLLCEMDLLHLPEDRLNIHGMKEIMLLCGGYVGARFTSEDMRNMAGWALSLNDNYLLIDEKYLSLTPIVRRSVPSAEKEETSDESEPTALARFLELVGKYLDIVKIIQAFVAGKHVAVRECKEDSLGSDAFSNKDPDNLPSALAKPLWQTTLLSKYEAFLASSSASTNPVVSVFNTKRMTTTCGKFCAFLSSCMVKPDGFSAAEGDAVQELLEATSASIPQHSLHSQEYYARRFFDFISKLSEFKSMPKDEKSLFLFEPFQVVQVPAPETISMPDDPPAPENTKSTESTVDC